MVSSINSPATTSGVRIGGKRLTAEIIRFIAEHYGQYCRVTDDAIPDKEKLLQELEICRAETRQIQLNPGNYQGKLNLVMIGHSLGGLYTRYALGLLYEAQYFHKDVGPLEPLVC